MFYKKNLLILLTVLFYEKIFTRQWQFSPFFLEFNQTTTPIKIEQYSHHNIQLNPDDDTQDNHITSYCSYDGKPQTNQPLSLTRQEFYKCINILSMLYASIKIIKQYNNIYVQTIPDTSQNSFIISKLKNFSAYMCPQFLKKLNKHGQFFINSLEIIIETLIFKYIAKLIILCGSMDILDKSRKKNF